MVKVKIFNRSPVDQMVDVSGKGDPAEKVILHSKNSITRSVPKEVYKKIRDDVTLIVQKLS